MGFLWNFPTFTGVLTSLNIYHPRKTHGRRDIARRWRSQIAPGHLFKRSCLETVAVSAAPWETTWRGKWKVESGKIRRIFFRVNQQWAMTRAILAIFPRVAFMAKKIQTDAQRVPNDFTETRFRAEMPRWTGRVFMFSHFGGLQHEVFAEACMVWQPIFFLISFFLNMEQMCKDLNCIRNSIYSQVKTAHL